MSTGEAILLVAMIFVLAQLFRKDSTAAAEQKANRDAISALEERLETMEQMLSQIQDRLGDLPMSLAHRDKRRLKSLPKFHDVDACIDLMDELYVKYHLLFHAQATDSLMPTYQYDWKEIFYDPWIVRAEN